MAVCKRAPASLARMQLIAAFPALLLLWVVALPQASGQPYNNMMDVLADPANNLSIFKNLVVASGLEGVFSNSSFDGTGFFPTDAALQEFALTQQLGGTNALEQLGSPFLANFVKYHVSRVVWKSSKFFLLTELGTGIPSISTLLSSEYKFSIGTPTLRFTMLRMTNESHGSTLARVLHGTDGKNATIVATDIVVNNGTSYVHIIDAALGYWYANLATAATQLKFGLFYAALVNANKTNPSLMPTNAPLQYFAPDDSAVNGFIKQYPFPDVNIASPNLTLSAIDIISHHVTSEIVPDLPQVDTTTTVTTFSSQFGNQITITASSDFVSCLGITSEMSRERAPVGGIVPSSYVSVLYSVLLPVYGNIWQYLDNPAPQTPGVTYLTWMSFLQTTTPPSTVVNRQLQYVYSDPSLSITLLAPNDIPGVSAFLVGYTVPNLVTVFPSPSTQRAVQETHVINKPLTKSNFTNNAAFTTMSGAEVTSRLIGSNSTNVFIYAAQTSAMINARAYDIGILYGRSYVHSINYVLVPAGVSLPGGAAGAPSVPSLLLLAVSAVVGRMALAHLIC